MARTALMVPVVTTVTAVCLAVPAAAVPDCTDTAPNVRTCVTPGHTAITTSPNPAFTNPWPGWGFTIGTPVFGLGGGGLWLGF